MVNRNSSGPWERSLASITASAAATPMPLSAPSVVPSAWTQSPSSTGVIGSFSKSCFLPSFFSHTMSRWPCRIVGLADSRPLVAALLTMTLPAASCRADSPMRLASARTKAAAAFSFLDPRGIALSARKCFHRAFGSRF